MALPPSLQQALEDALGVVIRGSKNLSGGCIHNSLRIDTNWDPIFVKYNQVSALDNLQAEARGLQLLHQTNTVRVANPLKTGSTDTHAWLAAEYLAPGSPKADYWEVLGRGLAKLHKNTRNQFGLDHDNYIGALPQLNPDHQQWSDFFVHARLMPMMEMALQKGHLDTGDMALAEKLADRIEGVFPEEPPALIHGDLWGGNRLCTEDGKPALIDPAVYFGHREMELAFMSMFDRIPPNFYPAYEEVYPLAPGYRDRFDLANLYPTLVHVNLFGGGYISSARSLLRRYGG